MQLSSWPDITDEMQAWPVIRNANIVRIRSLGSVYHPRQYRLYPKPLCHRTKAQRTVRDHLRLQRESLRVTFDTLDGLEFMWIRQQQESSDLDGVEQ